LLDTLCVPDIEQKLLELSKALGVSSLRIPVGLDHFASHFPEKLTKSENAKPEADYAMALDLLATLASCFSEAEVIAELFRIVSMLFAPASVLYFQFSEGKPAAIQYSGQAARPLDDVELRQCQAFDSAQSPLASGSQLVVPLNFQGERLALCIMDGFATPTHREDYRNLLESIMPICSLSISNARKVQEIQRKSEVIQIKQTELISMIKLKDRIFSIIAHDLKGPVGGIATVLKYLSSESVLNTNQAGQELLYETHKAADAVLLLLANLLEWGKSAEDMLDLNPVVLDFEGLIKDIFGLLHIQAEAKGLTLKLANQAGFCIYADSKTISIALRNLISNALKFTPRGGTVTVKTETNESVKSISVSDTGIGMTKETIARILASAKVVSTKGTEGESGTGLGLLLSQDYIERNGGKLSIESCPGVGTTMRVEFLAR